MKPSALGRPFLRTLPLIAGAAVLMVGIACGGAETPAAAPTAATAAATEAPAMAQPTNTPIPEAEDATVRPTNTPAPTAAPRVAATPTPSAGPVYGGLLKMSAYADTKDWDPRVPRPSPARSRTRSCTTSWSNTTQWTPMPSPAT